MEIKLAKKLDKNSIEEYCQKYGFHFPTTNSIYIAWKDDKIVGLFGLEIVVKIEPFISDNPVVAKNAYNKILDIVNNQGIKQLECFTTNEKFPKVKDLFEKLGFIFIEQTNRFVKILEEKDADN